MMMRFLRYPPPRKSDVVTRAVVLPYFGGPEVLELQHNKRLRVLEPNEVLVRTHAASINSLDIRLRSGYGGSILKHILPFTMGSDVSGEVAKVGSSVRKLKVGQQVFGASYSGGTWADYCILSEDELATKPPSITHVEACAIPFAAATARNALKSVGKGDRVLVLGGGGSVGFAAIQLAVASGCHVTATSGSHGIDRILAAGAEQAVDHTVLEDIKLAIKGRFDVVIDTIGAPKTEKIGINVLDKGGRYTKLENGVITSSDRYGMWLGIPMAAPLLLKKKIDYLISHRIEYSHFSVVVDALGLEEVRRLTEAGKLKIPVEKTFPIAQVREAHEAKDKMDIPGKVVLEFD
ncbi:hypothetical protein FEM48_Zijuj05G0055500 [Ziziphus jujuba var. spinosa]|uniref:Enoyl reductase (ER) domain-containing protein n=1 Tax=Ziziphus jujuba var. spinosa TaxID=714518 RepID=A0A978VD39_ZIZJJ|nr:hypothetical protein FEM48_Zijuj05G0055500 [Ziziphus jujuba var. spinosa]